MTDTIDIFRADRAVDAGATWLDQHAPGWTYQIDLDALFTRSPERCPAGQVFGDFYKAPFGKDFDTVAHGFDADTPEEFELLDDAWRRLVTARRHAEEARQP